MVYITLLSNDCTSIYASNHPSSFKNRFDTPITVSPRSECALTEIHFTNVMKEIDDTPLEGSIKVFDFLATDDGGKTFGRWSTETLTKTCFVNADELTTCLNECLWRSSKRLRNEKKIVFTYDTIMEKLWLNFETDDWITVLIEGKYLTLLGVEKSSTPSQLIVVGRDKEALSYMYQGKRRYFAKGCQEAYTSVCHKKNYFEHSPQIARFGQFIVFCDIIEETICGGGRNKILRFVEGTDQEPAGKSIVRSYDGNRMYLPLTSGYLSAVGISIGLVDNSLVPFAKPTRITLHIRDR